MLGASASCYEPYPKSNPLSSDGSLVKSNSAPTADDAFPFFGTENIRADNIRKKDTRKSKVKRAKSSDGSNNSKNIINTEDDEDTYDQMDNKGVQLPLITPAAFKPSSRGKKRVT
jgi:hypothetical protein